MAPHRHIMGVTRGKGGDGGCREEGKDDYIGGGCCGAGDLDKRWFNSTIGNVMDEW